MRVLPGVTGVLFVVKGTSRKPARQTLPLRSHRPVTALQNLRHTLKRTILTSTLPGCCAFRGGAARVPGRSKSSSPYGFRPTYVRTDSSGARRKEHCFFRENRVDHPLISLPSVHCDHYRIFPPATPSSLNTHFIEPPASHGFLKSVAGALVIHARWFHERADPFFRLVGIGPLHRMLFQVPLACPAFHEIRFQVNELKKVSFHAVK